MKKDHIKNASWAGLALTLIFTLAFSTAVFAATKPKISTIEKKTSTSVTLPITYKTLKNKKVKVKIQITNKKTDKKTTVTESAKLNYKGEDSVIVDGLTAETDYSFKVKIKKTSSKSAKYSSWSNSKETETEK